MSLKGCILSLAVHLTMLDFGVNISLNNGQRFRVEVEIASEFRYRDPLLSKDGVALAISQSGETADTLAGIKLAKDKGLSIIGLCNVVGSSVARESDYVVYTQAGS